MFTFLKKEFFNNSVETYLYVFGAVLLAVLLKRYLSKFFATRLYRLVSKSGKTVHKKAFVDLIIPPLEIFLLLFISFVAFEKLNFPETINIKIYRVRLFEIIDAISNMALIGVFIWLCIRVIDFIALVLEEKATLTKDQSDNQLIIFFKDFFKAILIIIGILLILRFAFNKDVGNLITGLSIAGAAIALATKESLENLIASFIIFFDKPFTVGDTIKLNSFSGTIEKIGLRSTRIRTEEKTYISIPNKLMVDSIVDNISLRSQRKGGLQLEIELSTKANDVKKLITEIEQILAKHSLVSFTVLLKDTGKNAHIIEVDYFTSVYQPIEEFNQLKQLINLEIVMLLEDSQIKLAASSK
ncbi:MAG: mechanosensitive ion channel family protein [Chitinophagaceae bacterium]